MHTTRNCTHQLRLRQPRKPTRWWLPAAPLMDLQPSPRTCLRLHQQPRQAPRLLLQQAPLQHPWSVPCLPLARPPLQPPPCLRAARETQDAGRQRLQAQLHPPMVQCHRPALHLMQAQLPCAWPHRAWQHRAWHWSPQPWQRVPQPWLQLPWLSQPCHQPWEALPLPWQEEPGRWQHHGLRKLCFCCACLQPRPQALQQGRHTKMWATAKQSWPPNFWAAQTQNTMLKLQKQGSVRATSAGPHP